MLSVKLVIPVKILLGWGSFGQDKTGVYYTNLYLIGLKQARVI